MTEKQQEKCEKHLGQKNSGNKETWLEKFEELTQEVGEREFYGETSKEFTEGNRTGVKDSWERARDHLTNVVKRS